MAVFLDLEDDDCPSHGPSHTSLPRSHDQLRIVVDRGSASKKDKLKPEGTGIPSIATHQLAAALTCYPYAFDG
jgi:hypothetical protein